jgi:predicted enzyme related to lactoylglutathione lyase
VTERPTPIDAARPSRVAARAWPALLLATTLAAPAASAAGLPPLEAPPTTEHHPGKMIFAELVTPSVTDAERFYGGLFGWTFRDVPVQGTHYVEALNGGAQIAGLIERPLPADGSRRPAWLTFLSTTDADATVAAATAYGARILFPTRDVPDLGREAVLADPQGATVAILASATGDPPDFLTDDGDWIWSSLFTPDPGASAAFYNRLFTYQVTNATDSTSGKHLVLASGNYARASINSIPPGRPDDRARWLNFVRVENAADMAAKAAALGGRVLVAPHADRDGNPVAIIADPEGAVFGLLQWSDQSGEDVK